MVYMTDFTPLPQVIASRRLDLFVIPLDVLKKVRDRCRNELADTFGMAVATTWMDGMEGRADLWIQRRMDPALDPSWLARAIALRETHTVIGHMGFHLPPDSRGMVEIGYTIEPDYRHQGYAREAALVLASAAAAHGAAILRASVSPENTPSLAVIAHLGLKKVGVQEDEKDGTEVVFEGNLPLTTDTTS